MATHDTTLLREQLDKVFALPKEYVLLNYLRCHDDIGWDLDYDSLKRFGIEERPRKAYLNNFFRGYEGVSISSIVMLHAYMFMQSGIPVLYSGDEIGQLNEEADHADRNKAEDSRYLHRGKMGWSAATLEPATGPSSASAAAWTGSSWWDCSISAARQGPPLPCTAKGSMRIC